MQIYKVTGQVTLSRAHPSFRGGTLLTAEAYGAALLGQPEPSEPEMVVIWDEFGASTGSLVAVSDGAEAAQAFRPAQKPVDAYCAAILDAVSIHPETLKQWKS